MDAGAAAEIRKTEDVLRKAKEYDAKFAWSDTCCIGKSSNTDLDEPIRSMFRWYKRSATCTVHVA
jgi:hypothetical protein